MCSLERLRSRATNPLLPALIVALAGLVACGVRTPESATEPATRAETVLALFDLARADEADPERVERLFGRISDERERADLLDAIDALQAVDEVEIVETYSMDDLVRDSFDLVGHLPGGGLARFSVQLDTAEEPGTIIWFSGPGVEWPTRRLRGPGLSTSAPPDAPEGG